MLIKPYNVFIVKHCLPTINAEYQLLNRKRLKLNIIYKSNFHANITHMHLTRPTITTAVRYHLKCAAIKELKVSIINY